jgi:competence protein ComEC
VAFLLGLCSLLVLPHIPSLSIILSGFVIGLLSLGIYWKSQRVMMLMAAGMLLGFSWGVWHAYKQEQLPSAWQNLPLVARGKIISLPTTANGQTQFTFALQQLCLAKVCQTFSANVALYWQQPKSVLQAGQHWQLLVKLKRPHSYANPGSFDKEAWLFQQGIFANGYVISNNPINQLTAQPAGHTSIRQHYVMFINHVLANYPFAGVITALTIGNTKGISSTQWQVFRNTGTTHLIAISGLHIGMIAAVVYWLIKRCWRLSAWLCLRYPAPLAGAWGGLIAASIYAVFAGFSIPAQRALIMIAVWMLAQLCKQYMLISYRFIVGLFLVMLLDPLAVMNLGFWLSFMAIAMIGYGMSCRLSANNWWWRYGRVQWVATVGLIPVSWLLFQQVSIAGLVANIIAIPWVGWSTVPLALAGCLIYPFSSTGATSLLMLAEKTLQWLWPLLTKLSQMPYHSWYISYLHPWLILPCLIAALLLLAPSAMPARWLAIIGLLPVMLITPSTLPMQALRMTVLDVGQGLAVILQTRTHVLVYDTGMGYPDGYNLADVVVIPFLRNQHITHIDKLLISHGDADHAGGVAAIMQYYGLMPFLTSEPTKFAQFNAGLCQPNQQWQWDGVNFHVLYPPLPLLGKDNNSSCVLQVTAGKHKVLLPGDIERAGEQQLVQMYHQQLAAEIIIAPHHGSKSSSSPAFLQAVQPAIGIFSTGYFNRYHFPSPLVIQRYQQQHMQTFNTAQDGAITLTLLPNQAVTVQTYRQQYRHFWLAR